MATKFYSRSGVTISLIITAILIIVLFPMLLDKYGMAKALLMSLLIPVAMFLGYLRWYWILRLINGRKGKKQVTK